MIELTENTIVTYETVNKRYVTKRLKHLPVLAQDKGLMATAIDKLTSDGEFTIVFGNGIEMTFFRGSIGQGIWEEIAGAQIK